MLKGLSAPNIGLGEAVNLFETVKSYSPCWSISAPCGAKNIYSDEKLLITKDSKVEKIKVNFTFANKSNGNIFLVLFSKENNACKVVGFKSFAVTIEDFNKPFNMEWDISDIALEADKQYYLGISSAAISSYTKVSTTSSPENFESIWAGNAFISDEEVAIGKTFTCHENVKNGSPFIEAVFLKYII